MKIIKNIKNNKKHKYIIIKINNFYFNFFNIIIIFNVFKYIF